MKKTKRFLYHIFQGLYVNNYPFCCVWHFALLDFVSSKAPTAFLNGCTINQCNFAHCPKCADKFHPTIQLFNTEVNTLIIEKRK